MPTCIWGLRGRRLLCVVSHPKSPVVMQKIPHFLQCGAARCCLIIGLLAFAATAAFAQVAGYTFSQSVGTYAPITGGTVLAQCTPSSNYTLDVLNYRISGNAFPFPFTFNGSSYTSCYVTPKGYITFGANPPHTRLDVKPNSNYYDVTHPLSSTDDTGFDGAVSAFGAQIIGSAAPNALGSLRYQTIGTAPNRVLIIQWANMVILGNSSSIHNFQIRLRETSNVIELAYGNCSPGANRAAEVGLRGFDTGDFAARTGTAWAASVAGAVNTAAMPVTQTSFPPAGLLYTFTPSAPLPCAQPFSLLANPLTGTTATLVWRTNGPSPGPYRVVYGPAGFDPATATPFTATGPSLPITGLTPFTEYEFYVTQLCGGAAGSSPRSVKGSFRTTVLNDDPVGAVALPIGASCQPVGSTLAGATITSSAVAPGFNHVYCGNSTFYDIRYDVWFTFTTAATGPASTGVQLLGTGNAGGQLRLFTSAGGAAGPFVPVFCASFPLAPLVVGTLQPSTTYYVMVGSPPGFGVVPEPFTLCATEPAACSAPTALASDIANSTGTTAQLTFVPGNGATSYTVTYTPVGGGPTRTVTPPPTGSPAVLTGLAPATNYTVTLQANCGTSSQSGVQTLVASTRPANATAAQAQVLPVGASCQPVLGSTRNAIFSAAGVAPVSSCSTSGATAIAAVWYRFTTPATGPASQAVRISVVPAAGTAAGQLRVLAGPGPGGPFTEVACQLNTGSIAAPLEVRNLSPATTYYVVVAPDFGQSANGGPFTICLTEPATCGTPQGVAISSVTATSANLTYLPGTPAAGAYTVQVGVQGAVPAAPVSIGPTGLVPLTNLQPGTYYVVTLTGDCAAAGQGQSQPQRVTFRTSGPAANDLCANAQLLACGQLLNGATTGATAAGDPAPGTLCGPAVVGSAGVWYRFVGTGDDVTFSTCGSPPPGQAGSFAQALHVFSGNCGALTCLGGNAYDLGCASSSGPHVATYTLATTAGTAYYVLVSSADGLTGDFVLSATCSPAGSCPPPTAPSLTVNPAGTLATVRFVPAPGTTYTVVSYALANGTGLAYGSRYLASPVDLNRVQPGQNYVLTLSSYCGPTNRSTALMLPFSTVLANRVATLAALVALYPNPTQGNATLALPAGLLPQAATATLCNALGQAVRNLRLPANATRVSLDLQGLSPGTYWLRLPIGQGTVAKPLQLE